MRIFDYETVDGWLWRLLRGYGVAQILRKRRVFLSRLTAAKLINAARLGLAFALRRPQVGGVPIHLKVDVAPSCQLECPVCPHGSYDLADFKSPALMKTELFERLVDGLGGKTIAMSLYNLGEPLLHPKLPEMAKYADDRGINTYITTNFSLPLKQDYIERLVASGLKSLIVAVDGLSDRTFGTQRKKGDWNLVSRNLEMIQAAKLKAGSRFPEVVIQFIVFDFNEHERPLALTYAEQVGVSELHFIRGTTKPWLEIHAPSEVWAPKPAKNVPLCAWPYFSAIVGSRGEVVPCCHHRMADSYVGARTVRSLGSIATHSIADVYASPAYAKTRSMVSDPGRATEIGGHFCEGCKVLTH